MKATTIILIIFASVSLTALGEAAQKIGYVSTAFILSQLPQTQKANEEIKEMQANFQAQGQNFLNEIKTKYDGLIEKTKADQLSENMKQLGQQELTQLQQDFEEHNKRSQETLNKRRSVLMKPILKMINETIRDIADEQSYDLVIDVQESGVLYGSPEYNLTRQVLTALGVEIEVDGDL